MKYIFAEGVDDYEPICTLCLGSDFQIQVGNKVLLDGVTYYVIELIVNPMDNVAFVVVNEYELIIPPENQRTEFIFLGVLDKKEIHRCFSNNNFINIGSNIVFPPIYADGVIVKDACAYVICDVEWDYSFNAVFAIVREVESITKL